MSVVILHYLFFVNRVSITLSKRLIDLKINVTNRCMKGKL